MNRYSKTQLRKGVAKSKSAGRREAAADKGLPAAAPASGKRSPQREVESILFEALSETRRPGKGRRGASR